jgi:hypothetical protein
MYYFFIYRKKFDITVKVISRRANEKNKVYFDKGAILRDKKNNTDFLRLLTSHVELELPKFNLMTHTNRGDYLEVIRDSERGFRFLTPPRVEREWIVRSNGKLFPMSRMKQIQLENDITWILERMKTNKKIISPESVLMQILAYTPQIISMAFSMIIVWIVFRYAPSLLSSMQQVIQAGSQPTEAPTEVLGFIPLLLTKWKKKI